MSFKGIVPIKKKKKEKTQIIIYLADDLFTFTFEDWKANGSVFCDV